MIFITRSELNRMVKQVLDTNTGMTALDRFENEHCYEDWHIIEDVERKSARHLNRFHENPELLEEEE